MGPFLDRRDAAVARIAARQHGVVSGRQLERAGFTRTAIRHRVAAGRLFRLHRGVYAVGHDGLSDRGRWKAATLACGEGAVLSHTSAAALWGMLDSSESVPHVTGPTHSGRPRRTGITLHRIADLERSETTKRDNIPVTQPQRTLADLKSLVRPGLLRLAIRQAEIRNLPVDAAALIRDRATSGLELEFLTFVAGIDSRFPRSTRASGVIESTSYGVPPASWSKRTVTAITAGRSHSWTMVSVTFI